MNNDLSVGSSAAPLPDVGTQDSATSAIRPGSVAATSPSSPTNAHNSHAAAGSIFGHHTNNNVAGNPQQATRSTTDDVDLMLADIDNIAADNREQAAKVAGTNTAAHLDETYIESTAYANAIGDIMRDEGGSSKAIAEVVFESLVNRCPLQNRDLANSLPEITQLVATEMNHNNSQIFDIINTLHNELANIDIPLGEAAGLVINAIKNSGIEYSDKELAHSIGAKVGEILYENNMQDDDTGLITQAMNIVVEALGTHAEATLKDRCIGACAAAEEFDNVTDETVGQLLVRVTFKEGDTLEGIGTGIGFVVGDNTIKNTSEGRQEAVDRIAQIVKGVAAELNCTASQALDIQAEAMKELVK